MPWSSLFWMLAQLWLIMAVLTAYTLSEACGEEHCEEHVRICVIAGIGWVLTFVALYAQEYPEDEAEW